MSINDPVRIEFDTKHGWYYPVRGREAFYIRCEHQHEQDHWKVNCYKCDHQDEMIVFLSREDAERWVRETLHVEPESNPASRAGKRGGEEGERASETHSLPDSLEQLRFDV